MTSSGTPLQLPEQFATRFRHGSGDFAGEQARGIGACYREIRSGAVQVNSERENADFPS